MPDTKLERRVPLGRCVSERGAGATRGNGTSEEPESFRKLNLFSASKNYQGKRRSLDSVGAGNTTKRNNPQTGVARKATRAATFQAG